MNRNVPDNSAVENPQTASPARAGAVRRFADKFMTGKGIFTFLRSSVSSQIASWIDMGVCFVFYAWVFMPMGKDPMRSFLATAIGLIVGGIVNCCINYKFTFRAANCSVKAVAVKYFLIWGGSFLLNIGGTTTLNHLLQKITWLGEIGVRPDGIFAFSRLFISLVVSLAWNFLLQKNFVYIPTRFDPYAIRFVNRITFRRNNDGSGNDSAE
ncbi:MAG: hypothetical protein HDS68_08785 [Bacteroidales bacterium]|nr:hypothetical protein [Bacteroidales bacterium]